MDLEGFEEDGGDYQMTSDAGGAVYTNESKGILVYFGTSDIDASVARVRELGGSRAIRRTSRASAATPRAPTRRGMRSGSSSGAEGEGRPPP